jgi:hypothetical protein
MMPDLCLKVQRKREFMNFQNASPKSGKTQNYAGVDKLSLMNESSQYRSWAGYTTSTEEWPERFKRSAAIPEEITFRIPWCF